MVMHHVALKLVDPSRNCFRHYAITECKTLFEDHALLISWGRIGKAPRTRCEVFASEGALNKRRDALLAVRRAHGYQPEA
jgi:predicted DNA-binding WGR domain protein